jgi:hypothetical protein
VVRPGCNSKTLRVFFGLLGERKRSIKAVSIDMPAATNADERSHTPTGKWIKGTRWSLLKSPQKQSSEQLALLAEV